MNKTEAINIKTKQIHIQPRRSGKTTKIIEMFIKDRKKSDIDSIIIVPNLTMKKSIVKEISKRLNYPISEPIISRIYTPVSLKGSYYLSVLIDNVYIDEALFCNKQKLWEAYASILYECNVIAYSTSDRLYSRELIELTKTLKRNPIMRKYIDKNTLYEIDTCYWENILTEDFEIIAPYNRELPEDEFRTECMGEFYETT